jgi:hypothetical protein
MSISKREKVFVALALLAALYGGIVLLLSGRNNEGTGGGFNEKPAEEFLREVAESLARHQLTTTEKIILEKTEAPWPSQPFVSVGTPVVEDTSESQSQGDVAHLVYTGYIEVGNRRLAIINGMEYDIGDPVADASLTVRGITSERVILGDTTGSRLAIPIVDGSNRSTALILHQSQ